MKIILSVLTLFLLVEFSIGQVAVIANKSFKKDTISKSELLDSYTGDIKKWEDGQKVVVFDLDLKTKTKEAFYKFLGKSPSRMKSIWMKRMLSGEGNPPPAVNSDSEMLKKIEETKGAIGFVKYDSVSTGVKVIAIIEWEEN